MTGVKYMKSIPEKLTNSFQQLGFFVIENFISDAEVAQIHSELSRLKKENWVPQKPTF